MIHPTSRAMTFAEIETLVVTGTRDLLVGHGWEVDLQLGRRTEVRGLSVMSAIGFAATTVRGAILLVAPRDAIAGLVSAEPKSGRAPRAGVHDVVGEFASSLANRLKTRLQQRGVAPFWSTPTTVVGDELVAPPSLTTMSTWNGFGHCATSLSLRLDVTFEPAGFPHDDEPRLAALGAGEAVLF